MVQLEDHRTEHLTSALSDRREQQPEVLVKTLTWDRGMELADHQTITKTTGVEVFFSDPLSPWQRGTNENTNGLIRQYLPKKTNLNAYSQADLDAVAHELNSRPSKCLGFRTPSGVEQVGVTLTI